MKKYIVLGFRDFLYKDEKSEADNPYIFTNLKKAIELADEVSQTEGIGTVVAIEEIYTTETVLSK